MKRKGKTEKEINEGKHTNLKGLEFLNISQDKQIIQDASSDTEKENKNMMLYTQNLIRYLSQYNQPSESINEHPAIRLDFQAK